MKVKTIKIINLIVAVLIALFCIGQAFAWLVEDRITRTKGFGGSSAGAYFAYGDGSQDNPFGINTKYHMYNLAWLQNTGRLTKSDGSAYYFELDPDMQGALNMDDVWLPPIGNDDHPFASVFDGNGMSIANVKITTNKNKLTSSAATGDYRFSNAVGLFGMTTGTSSVSNFVLVNPIVEAAMDYTSYAPETSSNKAIGLAVGHVEGKCYSIGVRATDTGAQETKLDIQKAGYSTFNSILGELGENVTSSVTGGGHSGSGGSGNAFGASFDVSLMLERLNKIKENKKGSDSSFLLPDIDSSNDFPVPQSYAKMPFTVTDKSTYTGSTAREVVSDQNVGYFLGNQNKFASKKLTFGKKLDAQTGWTDWTDDNGKTPAQSGKVPLWFYTNTNTYETDSETESSANKNYSTTNTVYKAAAGFNELSQEEYDELPQGIKDLLPASTGEKTFTPIRISQTYKNNGAQNFGNDSNEQWSYHGQISWMGKTYGKGFRGPGGLPVDENGNVLTDCNDEFNNQKTFNAYFNGVALPNCAIWFKPAQVGKFRFVMYADKAGEGFTLLKYERQNADKDNPFKVDPSKNGDDFAVTEVIKCNLPSDVLFYYEYNVTQAELEAGNFEYVLMQYGNGGAYFMYLDIGASAADDTSGVDMEKGVSAVDFIYDGVEITQQSLTGGILKGDFIVTPSGGASVRYESSKTSVYFENLKAVLAIVFVRLYNQPDGKTIKITVTPESAEVTATNPNLIQR